VNFVTKNVAEYLFQETHDTPVAYVSPATYPRHHVRTPLLSAIALHHQRLQRPRARHAYRLSQIITYGVPPPQTFVN
jgi:hypothetical protein